MPVWREAALYLFILMFIAFCGMGIIFKVIPDITPSLIGRAHSSPRFPTRHSGRAAQFRGVSAAPHRPRPPIKPL